MIAAILVAAMVPQTAMTGPHTGLETPSNRQLKASEVFLGGPALTRPKQDILTGEELFTGPANISLTANGTVIEIRGSIGPGTYLKFMETVRKTKNAKQVRLASAGGLASEARLVHNAVRKQGLSTHVEHLCASACADIFLGGAARTIATSGRLGFHQSYVKTRDGQVLAGTDIKQQWQDFEGKQRELSRAGHTSLGLDPDEQLRATFRTMGVSAQFADKVLSTKPETMWFPDLQELLSEKLVTQELAPQPAPSDVKRDVVDAELLTNIFWVALKETNPARYAEALDSVWRFRNVGDASAGPITEQRSDIISTLLDPHIITASDAVIDAFAQYWGDYSDLVIAAGYADCRGKPEVTEKDAEMMVVREDQLFAKLMRDKGPAVMMTKKQAAKITRKHGQHFVRTGQIALTPVEQDAFKECQIGVDLFRAIGQLDVKQRASVYRAFNIALEGEP